MESNGNSKSGLFTAGGVLSIVGAIPQIISGVALIAVFLVPHELGWTLIRKFFLPFLMPLFEPTWEYHILYVTGPVIVNGIQPRSHWPILGGCLVVLGIVAVIGGISAIRRKRFGLSLAGAICALPTLIEGFLAVIFILESKKKFE